jgi:tetratricopeptide (TPR) repeat protein
VLTALLFAIHPLRVESVAWIAERKGMLSAFFYLLSLISYIRYRASGRRAHYALCVLTFVLALMSKSMAMSQPFVLLLIDYLQGRSIDKKSLVEKAPFFGMAGVFACIAYFSVQDTMSQGPHFTIVQSILSPAYNICFYLVKTIFPLRLCALYNMTDHQAGLTLIMGLSAVAVCGIAAAVYFSRRLSKKPIFCALFFLVTLLPTLQIVSSGGWTTIADRYTYIPLIGVYFLIATAFSFLLQKAFRKNRAASIVLMVGGGAVMVIFGFMTYNQCSIWKDGLTLWNDVVNKSPSALAYSNRGFAYATQHEYERAIADYHRAVELNPGYAPIYNNLGNAYSALGDAALALDNYNHAIAIDNRYAQAFGNRGIAYKMTGDLNRAIDDFSQAIRLAPRYAQAYGNLGSAYCYRGDLDKAETAYNRAISLNPEYAEGYYGRGLALCFKGDLKRAVEDFNRAIAINPSYAEAYNSQGVAYRDMGNLQGAIESFTHALSLNSRYAQAYYGRGLAYKALGDFATASEDMHKACDLGIKAACE